MQLFSVYAAVWLFLNIKYDNRDKKWFRWLFKGKEWDPIIKAMELISQIEEYKAEDLKSPLLINVTIIHINDKLQNQLSYNLPYCPCR